MKIIINSDTAWPNSTYCMFTLLTYPWKIVSREEFDSAHDFRAAFRHAHTKCPSPSASLPDVITRVHYFIRTSNFKLSLGRSYFSSSFSLTSLPCDRYRYRISRCSLQLSAALTSTDLKGALENQFFTKKSMFFTNFAVMYLCKVYWVNKTRNHQIKCPSFFHLSLDMFLTCS